MLALCSMLHSIDYAKTYAGIMGAGLLPREIWGYLNHYLLNNNGIAFIITNN